MGVVKCYEDSKLPTNVSDHVGLHLNNKLVIPR